MFRIAIAVLLAAAVSAQQSQPPSRLSSFDRETAVDAEADQEDLDEELLRPHPSAAIDVRRRSPTRRAP